MERRKGVHYRGNSSINQQVLRSETAPGGRVGSTEERAERGKAGKRAGPAAGVGVPGVSRRPRTPSSALSWARAPSPCGSLRGARLPLCRRLRRRGPGAPLHRAASAAAARPPKARFYTIPKTEKTALPGPCHRDLKSRHRAEVPGAPERLTGKPRRGLQTRFGPRQPVSRARSYSRDTLALELTPPSPKCALRINY